MTIEAVAQELAEVIKRYDADYIEAHLEESQTSHITYRGRELESTGRATATGGNVRALVRGGWGFVSFNNLSELPGRVELAVKQAQFAGKETSKLATIEPVVDVVPAEPDRNPATIPLAERKQMLDEYNAIIWHTPEIQTSTIGYADNYKKVIFSSALLIAGTTALGYMTAGGFIQSFTTNPNGLNLERPIILTLISISAVIWTFFTWLSAVLSDKFGRKPVYIFGSLIQIITALVLFPLISTGNYSYIMSGLALLSMGIGITYGVQAVFYSELFPASIRFSGISITYAIGSIIGGAFAPLIAAALIGKVNGIYLVSAYLTVMSVIAFLAICIFKDRTGIALEPDAEETQKKSPFIWK